MWSLPALAADGPIRLTKLDLEYEMYLGKAADPILQPLGKAPKDTLSLNMGLSVISLAYIDATVHTSTDGHSYQVVGLEYEVGMRPCSVVDIYTRHHSQHLMDQVGAYTPPLENTVGIRIHLVRP